MKTQYHTLKANQLRAAYDVIETLYNEGNANDMYDAMGVTGVSVQDALMGLILAIEAKRDEVKA